MKNRAAVVFMDLETVKEVLESYRKSELPSNIQKLKNDKNLVNGIIKNLPEHYADQLSNPVYSKLFDLFCHGGKAGQLFVLQFVPVLIWTYLSATTRKDEQAYGNLEALLLVIYNSEEETEEQRIRTFRLPSLSRPSIYHEPYQGLATSSMLTETALSRHEQSVMVMTVPGPGRQLNKITAMHRLSVLSALLYQYNSNIVYMSEASHHSFCVMALRLAKCGFYKLCQGSKQESDSEFSREELTKLAHHPRITLSSEFIQEITHGLYFLMYNGQSLVATNALNDLHWRAAHGLMAPAHMLTSAIKHSLEQSGGLPKEGPLGLEMYQTDSQDSKSMNDESGNVLALTTSGLKMSASYMEYPAVSTEDISLEGEAKKLNLSSHQTSKEAVKSHKKAHSTGYFKRPGFLSPKEQIELERIPGESESLSELLRPSASETVVPSDKIEGVELLSTSFSSYGVLEHKF